MLGSIAVGTLSCTSLNQICTAAFVACLHRVKAESTRESTVLNARFGIDYTILPVHQDPISFSRLLLALEHAFATIFISWEELTTDDSSIALQSRRLNQH